MSDASDMVKHSYLHSTGYFYSENHPLKHGPPLRSGSFANPEENTAVSLHLLSETIRRKVVHHFGAEY